MRSNKEPNPFSQLFKLSIILVLVALLLTYDHDYSWSWFGVLGGYAIPLAMLMAFFAFYIPVVLISHCWLKLASFYQLMHQLHELAKELSWSQIVILSACAGLGEELLFRGFAQSWLSLHIGVSMAILVSSLIFALLHALTLYYFLFAFLISIIFGILLNLSQSMLLIVLFHAIYDVIALGVIAKRPDLIGLKPISDCNADDGNLSA